MPDNSQKNDLEFTIMPDLSGQEAPVVTKKIAPEPVKNTAVPKIPTPPPVAPVIPTVPKPPTNPVVTPTPAQTIMPKTPKIGNPNYSHTTLIMASVFILLVLVVGGYLLYSLKSKNTEGGIQISDPLILNEQDADRDGVTTDQEKQIGTDPSKADADGDGLADGDEVNVYQSDPLLMDTDSDTYDDGQEVANNYSPTVNSTSKVSAGEKTKWEESITKFGLHKPTQNTLVSKIFVTPTGQISSYKNATYNYSLDLPSIFQFREADNGQKVGLYITGTNPDDEDVLSDPVSISIAVMTEGQTLKDWVNSQYQAGDYEKLEEATINSIPAIKLTNMPGDSCTTNRTFFTKNTEIVIVTWTCNEISAFGSYYEQVVQSFKFTK